MKKSELIQIIKEEIESVLLEEKKSTVTPEVALQMLVKAIGPLKDSDNKPLNVGELLDLNGKLHEKVAKASALGLPVDKLVKIVASSMKEVSGTTQTAGTAQDLADKLRATLEAREAKAKKANKPQQQAQQGQNQSQLKVLKTNLGPDETMIVTVDGPQGTKKIKVKKRGGSLKIDRKLAAQDALKQYATSAKAP